MKYGAGLEIKMLKTTKVQSSESNISIDKFYDLSLQQRCVYTITKNMEK